MLIILANSTELQLNICFSVKLGLYLRVSIMSKTLYICLQS